MNHYITGATIKALRIKKQLTQAKLAENLGVSVIELMAGEQTRNENISANLLRSKGD